MRWLLLAAMAASLAGCGLPASVVVPIVTSTASYVASVNNLGAETLKVIDDKTPPKACPAPAKLPEKQP